MTTKAILERDNILLNQPPEDYTAVIRRCGELLQQSGYVSQRYTEGMLEREKVLSTALGNLIAIPHGERDYKDEILSSGIVVLTYEAPLRWGDEQVQMVIALAAKGEEHMDILERIAEHLEDENEVRALVEKADKNSLYDLLTGSSSV